MNAEDYARRVICDPPLLLVNTIRAAMAEARAQALREAIAIDFVMTAEYTEHNNGFAEACRAYRAELRKLAGGAT